VADTIITVTAPNLPAFTASLASAPISPVSRWVPLTPLKFVNGQYVQKFIQLYSSQTFAPQPPVYFAGAPSYLGTRNPP